MPRKTKKLVPLFAAVSALTALSACGSQSSDPAQTEAATVQPPTKVLEVGERLAGKNSGHLKFAQSGSDFVATYPKDGDLLAVTIAEDGTASSIKVTAADGAVVDSTPLKYFGGQIIEKALSTGEGAVSGSDSPTQQVGISQAENDLQTFRGLLSLEQANLIKEDLASAESAAQASDTYGVGIALVSVAQKTLQAIEADLSDDDKAAFNSRIDALNEALAPLNNTPA